MPSLTTQTSTNSNPCSIDGRIEFTSFNPIIDEQLEKKLFFAHQFITDSNRPDVVWGLREWIIKTSGYFDVIGYMRSPDLTYWFEQEAIIEEFDDLLLLFRDYVVNQKGIDPERKYRLIRYRDNLNFILVEIRPDETEELTDLGFTQQQRFVSELWPELQKEFVKFQVHLAKKYEHQVDIDSLFNKICWDGDNLLLTAIDLEITEE